MPIQKHKINLKLEIKLNTDTGAWELIRSIGEYRTLPEHLAAEFAFVTVKAWFEKAREPGWKARYYYRRLWSLVNRSNYKDDL